MSCTPFSNVANAFSFVCQTNPRKKLHPPKCAEECGNAWRFDPRRCLLCVYTAMSNNSGSFGPRYRTDFARIASQYSQLDPPARHRIPSFMATCRSNRYNSTATFEWYCAWNRRNVDSTADMSRGVCTSASIPSLSSRGFSFALNVMTSQVKTRSEDYRCSALRTREREAWIVEGSAPQRFRRSRRCRARERTSRRTRR